MSRRRRQPATGGDLPQAVRRPPESAQVAVVRDSARRDASAAGGVGARTVSTTRAATTGAASASAAGGVGAVLLIAQRELRAAFAGLYGWAILALVLMLDGLFFNAYTLGSQRPSSEVLSLFFYTNFGVTMAAAVFVTMRSFAAEREQRTLVLLLTSPAGDWQVVLGKFLGALGFVLCTVVAAAYIPVMVYLKGNLEWGQAAAGYLGIGLAAVVCTAIGIFCSAAAPNQLAAGVAAGFLVTLQVLFWLLSGISDPPLDGVFAAMDLYREHFEPFQDGAVHLKTLVYAPTVAFLFLLGAVRVLQARRWR